MKISVEVSDTELKEIQRATGERRKGPAIRNLAMEALMMHKRRAMTEALISGQWEVRLPSVIDRGKDRASWPR